MAVKMRNNITELVDFEKLKRSNDLCFKWAKRFNVKKREYMRFILNAYKKPRFVSQQLDVRYRPQFTKDCSSMFYAATVEDILINQYHAMILNILKKLRVSNDRYDDLMTDGFLSIRAATWQYRTYKVKASFTTFVHKAIFLRIQGRLNKEKEKRQRREKLKIKFACEFSPETFNIEQFSGNKDIHANTENIVDALDEIICNCKLNDQEALILRNFANRSKEYDGPWYNEYRNKYINNTLNKPFSRQSIYNQLEAVHKKVFQYLLEKDMVPIDFKWMNGKRRDFS